MLDIRLIQNDKHVSIKIGHEEFLVPEARKVRDQLQEMIKKAEVLQRPKLRRLGEY